MRCGDWLLTPARVAIHLPTRTAVAADLHLGYDRVRCRGGEAVPVRAVADELTSLLACLRENGISRLLVAGDLFEDGRHRRAELEEELLACLRASAIELAGVVPGNHDRGLKGSSLPVLVEATLGDWRVIHGDGERPPGRVIQGHEHPWLRWRPGVEGPCYLVADDHAVLPAYSANAAGGNVMGCPRWRRYRACVIAGAGVLDFGELGRLPAR